MFAYFVARCTTLHVYGYMLCLYTCIFLVCTKDMQPRVNTTNTTTKPQASRPMVFAET